MCRIGIFTSHAVSTAVGIAVLAPALYQYGWVSLGLGGLAAEFIKNIDPKKAFKQMEAFKERAREARSDLMNARGTWEQINAGGHWTMLEGKALYYKINSAIGGVLHAPFLPNTRPQIIWNGIATSLETLAIMKLVLPPTASINGLIFGAAIGSSFTAGTRAALSAGRVSE